MWLPDFLDKKHTIKYEAEPPAKDNVTVQHLLFSSWVTVT